VGAADDAKVRRVVAAAARPRVDVVELESCAGLAAIAVRVGEAAPFAISREDFAAHGSRDASGLRGANLANGARGPAESLFLELGEERIEGAVEDELEAAVRNAVAQEGASALELGANLMLMVSSTL